KMKNWKILNRALILFTASLLVISGCVKPEPDEPPVTTITFDPAKVLTIAQIKQMYNDSSKAFVMNDDYSIFGTVVMDEKSGNIYKSAFIEDNTGGLQINYFNPGGLYLGDSVRILLRGTTIENYHNLYQVNNLDVGKSIYKLKNNNFIEPELVTIALLSNPALYQSRVIRLENVQFASAELGKTWADSVNLIDENRYLEDCSGNSIIVRTSGYANFAGHKLPEGNGSLIAIASIYNNDPQLVIRTESEVLLNEERCNPGGEQQLITIGELRSLYAGGPTVIPDSTKIQGIIISDVIAENISGKNAFILGDDGNGVNLRFTDYHDYQLGDKVEINVSGIVMDEYNGLVQVQEIPLTRVIALGAATVPPPLERSIQQVTSDIDQYESKLVKFTNVTISGSGVYSGENTLNDGTGTIKLYTYNWASFANESYPAYAVDITGIVGQYGSSPQFYIRNLDDVVETGGGGGTVTSINQDFSSVTAGQDISLNNWLNIPENGLRKWQGKDLSGNKCAMASALGSGGANVIWLIAPPIDLSAMSNPVFSFESAHQGWLHDGLSLWISTDFDGSNVTAATWTELSCAIAGQSDPWNTWVGSGNISLSSYSGTGYVAFRYSGSDGAQYTPFMIDNVKLINQ
ncbi:MAG: choice-of-anchor J domain-containing protein, partial [Bacteroidales bacterium]|nr:choice-of-anchor J domain-containing protein [Bacteroidales bacterium]